MMNDNVVDREELAKWANDKVMPHVRQAMAHIGMFHLFNNVEPVDDSKQLWERYDAMMYRAHTAASRAFIFILDCVSVEYGFTHEYRERLANSAQISGASLEWKMFEYHSHMVQNDRENQERADKFLALIKILVKAAQESCDMRNLYYSGPFEWVLKNEIRIRFGEPELTVSELPSYVLAHGVYSLHSINWEVVEGYAFVPPRLNDEEDDWPEVDQWPLYYGDWRMDADGNLEYFKGECGFAAEQTEMELFVLTSDTWVQARRASPNAPGIAYLYPSDKRRLNAASSTEDAMLAFALPPDFLITPE